MQLKADVEVRRAAVEHMVATTVSPQPSTEDKVTMAVWEKRLKQTPKPQKGFDRSVTYGVADKVREGWESANQARDAITAEVPPP